MIACQISNCVVILSREDGEGSHTLLSWTENDLRFLAPLGMTI